jgi:uncharacterized membrane protein YhaH (DUF805 family)
MENGPVEQVKEKQGGWFRRAAFWKKALVVFLVLFAVLFVNALFQAARLGGPVGQETRAERMPFSAEAKARVATPQELFAPASPLMGEAEDRAVEGQVMPAGGAPMLPLDTWGRQLILNAAISLEVSDVRAAYNRIQAAAAAEGALVTSAALEAGSSPAEEESSRDYGHAVLVLRMPQSRFYAVRQRLLNLAGDLKGKVLRDEVSSEDVTEQYVDLKSRLRHWKSQEAQLLEIMRQAHKIADILVVREQLSSVQQEIERISGQLRFLENRVDLSTITVEVYGKGKAPVKPTFGAVFKQAGKDISAAWTKALLDIVKAAGWLAVAATYLLPFAVVIAIIWLPMRARRRGKMSAGPPA